VRSKVGFGFSDDTRVRLFAAIPIQTAADEIVSKLLGRSVKESGIKHLYRVPVIILATAISLITVLAAPRLNHPLQMDSLSPAEAQI
jgi:hypothetical protein